MKHPGRLLLILLISLAAGCSMPTGSTPIGPGAVTPVTPGSTQQPCLQSGDQNTINARLQGPDAIAVLCPGAVFQLTGSVAFTADGQQVLTAGLPTGDSRATLRIVSADLTTAVLMRDHNEAVLSNVIVDGNRPSLGPKSGDALIYAGGFSDGQIIRGNKIMNTRSWSSLQLIEGHSESQPCAHALVEGNQVGPAGTSDNMQWADGISLACTDSEVRSNVITDATDGGIVVFGAPGSVIEGNTVRAQTRTLLGGINMVDTGAYHGDYTGTIVRNNIIDAAGAVIRIGLGMGPNVWGCLPPGSTEVATGGTVTGNTLRGTHMQYGFAVDGVRSWTVTGNTDEATHTGAPSVNCGGLVASPPSGFQYNPAHAQGTFQPEFVKANLGLALWAIVSPRPGE